MELLILKCTPQQTTESGKTRPRSLFVKFTDPELYQKIYDKLEKDGADPIMINKFLLESEYQGETSYAFGLNCSQFTFDRVEKFGVLDAQIVFTVSDSGYCNAKIQVIDRVEQINGYTPPAPFEEEIIEGWATTAPEAVNRGEEKSTEENPFKSEEGELKNPFDEPMQNGDLPF